MDDILLYILIFAAGAYAGYRINEFFMRSIIHKMLDDAGVTTPQLEKFATHWKKELDDVGYDEEDAESGQLSTVPLN